ncbi:MAG TPA: glycosyltransferase family 4 protein, partial [Acidimicrobiales bacterium]|nr:glycosyltransferase family 4 protein [Acidimicrobiales bacterium]
MPLENLRIAYLAYRGNPHSGGQGVYTRYLTRELVAMGHQVTVFGGPPYPELDDGVDWVPVPSLDLYREPDPFRVPWPWEFKSGIDVAEFAIMCTAGFPEPLTFSWRARKVLAGQRDRFDLIHDNQCLGNGLLGLLEDGWPLLTTLHHPITVDRDLELADAATRRRRMTLRRWYGFLGMQCRVASQLPRVVTVSQSSKRDISAQMGVPLDRMDVVHVGVDHNRFRPMPDVERVPGRLMTTASADVPLKGLVPLLEALAKLRTEHDAELVVIGKLRQGSKIPATLERLGLEGAVRFVHGVSDEDIVRLYAEAQVAVVPSLYEGFSLPAVEAMACGTPIVATTGGALPEVVGTDGETGLLVPPSDPGALAAAIGRLLDEPALRARLGQAGRDRVLQHFTWRATAEGTVHQYRALLEDCARWPALGPDGRPPRLRRRFTRSATALVPPAGVPRQG